MILILRALCVSVVSIFICLFSYVGICYADSPYNVPLSSISIGGSHYSVVHDVSRIPIPEDSPRKWFTISKDGYVSPEADSQGAWCWNNHAPQAYIWLDGVKTNVDPVTGKGYYNICLGGSFSWEPDNGLGTKDGYNNGRVIYLIHEDDWDIDSYSPVDFSVPDLPDGTIIVYSPKDNLITTKLRHEINISYKVPIPSSGNVNDVSVEIIGGTSTVLMADQKSISNESVLGQYVITREFTVGQHDLKIRVKSSGKGSWSVTRVLTIVEGVVDEDNDGWDDRTGEYIFPPYPDTGDGPPQPPGSDATIFDYIKYLVDSVLYSLSQLVIMLRGFMSGLTQFTQILSQFFSFMPAQFSGIILLGLIMAVILRVLGR